MKKLLALIVLSFTFTIVVAQVPKDMRESVPLWMEYDETTKEASLHWLYDSLATEYDVGNFKFTPWVLKTGSEKIEGGNTSFDLGILEPGIEYAYHIYKSSQGSNSRGVGIITAGIELPVMHIRGKCLILIDSLLEDPLSSEIDRLTNDMEMDGWSTEKLVIERSLKVPEVKARIKDWYDSDYNFSQAVLLLGHIPVPYSGNNAYDGHSNHQGAWAADAYYAELNGSWTDNSVNNTSPSREANKNIPGDGKYDNSSIPGSVELEIGRVDFYNMPAFEADEIELTRKYLDKNHAFRNAISEWPGKALVENNFANFDEAFGQSGWRNFAPMFGGDKVKKGNYDVEMVTDSFLFSYGCGGGSYTGAGGLGNTSNLWAAKELKSVFTMVFGSYFGDWDIQNNFLRGALGSGDILANMWSGRPIWQLFHMATGKHIGYSTKFTQNANSGYYDLGYGAHSAHIALLGDPTLRLHPIKGIPQLEVNFSEGDNTLTWEASAHATEGYNIYRKTGHENYDLLAEFHTDLNFTDSCVASNEMITYMVKAVRLQYSGSGSYYNTSNGLIKTIETGENPYLIQYFADADGDGYGSIENDTLSCSLPDGFVDNNLDCDDSNALINPDGIEILDNGIDEDCDGKDWITSVESIGNETINLFPQPAIETLNIDRENIDILDYLIVSPNGKKIQKRKMPQQYQHF